MLNTVLKESYPEESSSGTLSIEAVDYGAAVGDAVAGINAVNTQHDNALLCLDSLISIESSLGAIDKAIEAGSLNESIYTSHLGIVTHEAARLGGDHSELAATLNGIMEMSAESYQLSVEAYTKARRGIIDTLVNNVWDALTNLVSLDSWTTAFSQIDNLFSLDRKKIRLLEELTAELKAGTRVLKKDPKLSKNTLIKLGVYSTVNDTFEFGKLQELFSEFFDLYKDGLIESSLSSVHDSLVQSVDNETTIDTHKASIKFIEKCDRLDLDDILYKDTKLMMLTTPVGSAFNVLQIVQSADEGMDYHSDNMKIPDTLYRDLKIGKLSIKDMITTSKVVVKDSKELRDLSTGKHVKSLLSTWVKNLRSGLATVFYSAGFGILSVKRMVRQYYLANGYVQKLYNLWFNLYVAWSSTLDLNIKLIQELTETKK
ncbi:MAG: hypothetical protein Q9M19_01070 [Mariprofundaceae bacterium]|nr:hypothetical protein [Mariprofundaceae bacterium]